MPAFALEGEPPCAAAAAGHGQGANGAGLHVPLSCPTNLEADWDSSMKSCFFFNVDSAQNF